MTFERYFQAVDYLQQRLWHELPIVPVERALQHRVRRVLEHFGDPHRRFPVIHVAGSAGKGSTAAMTAAILRQAGLRVGLYTSPHLQTFIERINVDGELIAPERFADLVLGVDPLVRRMHIDVLDRVGYGRPSLVEVAFAAGMRHFADTACDVAVVEAGLGGRTDYTNVFEHAPVRVITNVEYEHRERLGWSLESIAREKAAIVHPGETLVSGVTGVRAGAIVAARAAETSTRLWRAGREVRLRDGGTTFAVEGPWGVAGGLRVASAGEHQRRNAALAAAAAYAFAGATGRAMREEDVRCGLASVRLPGRMERVQERPAVLLDGAHNPVEARCLARALRDLDRPKRSRLIFVCGILADKDQAPMVRALAGVADRAIVTQPPLAERTGDPAGVIGLFARRLGEGSVAFEASPQAALALALSQARAADTVCVTGSMFLVGALRERWVPELRILERRSSEL